MKAIFKTKSNYGNLNNKELDVVEISGTRITCRVFSEEFNQDIKIDFTISELVKFTGSQKFPVILGLLTNRHHTTVENNFTISTVYNDGQYYLSFIDSRNGIEICKIECNGKDISQLRNFNLIDNN